MLEYILSVHPHGITIIHGCFGSEKTQIAAFLAENEAEKQTVHFLPKRTYSTFIAISSNAAADAALEKLKSSAFIVVGAHSLGLERSTLLKVYFSAQAQDLLADANPLLDNNEPELPKRRVPKSSQMANHTLGDTGAEDVVQADDNDDHDDNNDTAASEDDGTRRIDKDDKVSQASGEDDGFENAKSPASDKPKLDQNGSPANVKFPSEEAEAGIDQ